VKLTDLHRHRFALLELPKPAVPSQPSPLVELQAAAALMITDPQLFPELGNAGGVQRQLFTSPRRKVRCKSRRKAHAQIVSVLAKHTDVLTLRDGPTKKSGACAPLTERQLGEMTGLAKGDDPEHHDWRGMRALRAALRDLEDGLHVKRHQPRVQYCGRCGEEMSKGRDVCSCGIVRGTPSADAHWRWKSYPTIITLTKQCFQRFGLLEALEKYQAEEYERRKNRQPPPEPVVADIRSLRVQQKIFQATALAAKRAGLVGDQARERARQAERERIERERLERLFGKRLE